MDALVSNANVRLWWARLDSAGVDPQEDWALLSADELARAWRFVRAADAWRFIAASVAVERTSAAEVVRCEVRDWDPRLARNVATSCP
jgi:hypothetical protein